ncbi:MAG TPA: TolC family protein, partial [Niastella sp.]
MFRKIIITSMFAVVAFATQAQESMTLENILTTIEKNNPGLKMYESEARAFNEAAKGAYSWMPPEAGAGLYMTPYNTKEIKANESMMKEGMG